MKKISLSLFMLLSLYAFPQNSVMEEVNYGYLEKLIDLAKANYPRNKILDFQEESAKGALTASKVSFLDLGSVSYFYRPQNRLALNPENPFVFNGFQFGLSINPGSYFQKPMAVKQAKAAYEIAKLENQDYQNVLTNEVKSRYYNYLQLRNELTIANQEAQDAKLLFERIRGQYEVGEAELEDYSERKTSATQMTLIKMRTEVEYLKAKDALEEIIGVSLDEVNKLN